MIRAGSSISTETILGIAGTEDNVFSVSDFDSLAGGQIVWPALSLETVGFFASHRTRAPDSSETGSDKESTSDMYGATDTVDAEGARVLTVSEICTGLRDSHASFVCPQLLVCRGYVDRKPPGIRDRHTRGLMALSLHHSRDHLLNPRDGECISIHTKFQ